MKSKPNIAMAIGVIACGLVVLYMGYTMLRPHDLPMPTREDLDKMLAHLKDLETE